MADPEDVKKSGGSPGMKAWLPLLLTMAAMPLVAYAMTSFVLVPKLQALVPAEEGERSEGGTNEMAVVEPESPPMSRKARFDKIIVRLRDSGDRQMLAKFTMVSDLDRFERIIKSKHDHLIEEASTVMATFSLKQMEAPNARTNLRTNLMNAFNAVLETNAVKALYFTELAIQ